MLIPFVLAATGLASCGQGVRDNATPHEVSRYHALNKAALGLWWGSGCPDFGDCGCDGARNLAEEFTCQMSDLKAYDIPVSVYLFDGSAWSARDSSATNSCSGDDCCSWKLGDDVIERMSQDNVRALLHVWGGCHSNEQYARARGRLGPSLLGFYLDDGSSDDDLREVNDFMNSEGENWETVAKAFQTRSPATSNAGLSQLANVAYVGDLSYDFAGMREGFKRIVSKSEFLAAPYNEFTGYGFLDPGTPDEETFIRRLHFGAFQPVMAHTPYSNSDPWRPEYSPALLTAFRYYSWLHKELGPYFLSYVMQMRETPDTRVITAGPGSYTLRVGNEIFVPLVTDAVKTLSFSLPTGAWVDYWNEQRVVSGTLNSEPVPLGLEPIFVKLGAIIPMEVERYYTGHGTSESRGSLTVLVYPSGDSTFRYFEDATETWIAFSSTQSGDSLTLTAEPRPNQPILYRVARVNSRPRSVGVEGSRVLINQGGDIGEVSSEALANASMEAAWYYDANERRLIVKAPQ